MPSAEDWDLGFSNVVYVKTKASNDPTPGETVFVSPIIQIPNGNQSGEFSNGYSSSQNYAHYQGTNSVSINLQPTSPTSPSVLYRHPPLPTLHTRRPPLGQHRSVSQRVREPHEINSSTFSTYRIKPTFSWNTTTNIPTSRSISLPPYVSPSPRPPFSSTDQLPSTFGSRLRQARSSVVGGTFGAPPPSYARRYSCDYGQSSYLPANIASTNSTHIIHDVKVPSTYYNGNIATLRRPSFSRPPLGAMTDNGDVLSSRRPSFSSRPPIQNGDILSLRRSSFSRSMTPSSMSPSLHRRASAENYRPHSSLGTSFVHTRYQPDSETTHEIHSRQAESNASLRTRTQQAKEKIKYHQQLMDRFLPVSNGPVGDVRYDVEYKFVELADRMPEFEAYRTPSRRGSISSVRSAAQSRAGSQERTPYISQNTFGTPKVSEARQRIRDVLRSTSVNKDYHF